MNNGKQNNKKTKTPPRNNGKHPGGRPSDYGPHIVPAVEKYLRAAEDEEIDVLKMVTARGTEIFEKKLRVRLPSIEGLACQLQVSRECIYEWESDESKKEFSDIIKQLRAKQARMLLENGLAGTYNSTIAKLLLHKHGYVEKVETDNKHSGSLTALLVAADKRRRGDEE